MSATETVGAKSVATPKSGGRWRWLLIGSLALNLLFVGMLASAWMRGGRFDRGGNSGMGSTMSFIASLPAERRTELLGRVTAMRQDMRALRQQSREAARDRVQALTAEPFDRKTFLDSQTRVIEADRNLRLKVRDVIADTASAMTPDERRKFARWRFMRGEAADDRDGEPAKKGK